MAEVNAAQFEALLEALEKERIAHAATRQKLMDTQDQLDFAVGEVEVLKKQIEREKKQFEETFGILKKRALQESCRNVELENKCEVIDRENKTQAESLQQEADKMAAMATDLANQKRSVEHKQAEMMVAQQQEAYLAKVLQESSSKR